MNNSGIRIIQAPDKMHPFVLVYKEAGIPSAPLVESDQRNAFYLTAEIFPELRSVRGKKEIEHGLIHRIDTAASGLLLIASTQTAYDFLVQKQKEGKFIKKYKTECDMVHRSIPSADGFPQLDSMLKEKIDKYEKILLGSPYAMQKFLVSSKFRAFGPGRKQVRPVLVNTERKSTSNKVYSTEVCLRGTISSTNHVQTICKITAGYRHQVRCHLSWLGLPVAGDTLYNPNSRNETELCFEAFFLQFPSPETDEILTYQV